MAKTPTVDPFPLAHAKEDSTIIVERITEEAEAGVPLGGHDYGEERGTHHHARAAGRREDLGLRAARVRRARGAISRVLIARATSTFDA